MQNTPQQAAAFSAVSEVISILIKAVAGSGKTTTIVGAAKTLPATKKVVFCAFNASIAANIKAKVPANVDARTLHSLGFEACRNVMGKCLNVSAKKTEDIVKALPLTDEVRDLYLGVIPKLVSLAKNHGYRAPVSNEQWDGLMDRYSVVFEGDEFDYQMVNDVFETATDRTYSTTEFNKFTKKMQTAPCIDFDDQLYFPAIYNWPVAIGADVLMIDECQDLNVIQVQMIQSVAKRGVQIVCVGDPNQAIYAFRAADVEALNTLVSSLNLTVLPLTCSFRCSKAVVAHAKQWVPELEAAPNAIEGSVEDATATDLFAKPGTFIPGDLLVCRINAPLVRWALNLIRSGVPAVIQGSDIGEAMVRLAKFVAKKAGCGENVPALLKALDAHVEAKVAIYQEASKPIPGWVQTLQDQVDCLKEAAEKADTVKGLCKVVLDLFSHNDRPHVLLSSIHRAKGLEVETAKNTCYILRPELLPHPLAKKEWEKVQETNLAYIAATRAKNRLVYVR